MDKKKDSMAGMTSAQKAAVLKGKQRMNKDKIAKLGPLEDTMIRDKSGLRAVAGRLRQGNVDMSKTIGRLESSKDRSARSATYRLAKMKADAKARKRKIIEPDMRGVNASKRNRKIIEPDMRGVKASKKGKN
jgi:hypothetical protein